MSLGRLSSTKGLKPVAVKEGDGAEQQGGKEDTKEGKVDDEKDKDKKLEKSGDKGDNPDKDNKLDPDKDKKDKRDKPKGGRRSARNKGKKGKVGTEDKDASSEDDDDATKLHSELKSTLQAYMTASTNMTSLALLYEQVSVDDQIQFTSQVGSCNAHLKTMCNDYGNEDGKPSPQSQLRRALAEISALLKKREEREDEEEDMKKKNPSYKSPTASEEASEMTRKVNELAATLKVGKRLLDTWEVLYAGARSPMEIFNKRKLGSGCSGPATKAARKTKAKET